MNRRDFVSTLVTSAAAADLLKAQQSSTVKRVLVVFKCHLDVGFVDTQAAIIRRYFDDFYPRAIATAANMRQHGTDRYVWTTGSWLMYTYLKQATPQQAAEMEQAIARGDIAWHALPFTWQTELMDTSLITGCVGFSKALDRRFGKQTTGAKLSDVPGHTRGLVGPLAAAGITFLDVGVNSASTPPDVPDLFVWKDSDGALLTVMYHRLAYGGVVSVPGSDLVISVEVRDDNSGPHTLDEIRQIYAGLRSKYPGAEVHAASLTDIANAVQPYSANLPVLTQEIGDTWIYGVASDPTKLAQYRELLRLRAEWVKSGRIVPGDAADLAFLEKFSLAVEHTWGTDTKTWLDFDHYAPAALQTMLGTPKYKTVTGSWFEKRQDIQDSVAALGGELRKQAESRLNTLLPIEPSADGMQTLEPGTAIETKRFLLRFSPQTGAIIYLKDKLNGRVLASESRPLALFTYQTYSKQDYDKFLASYITVQTDWAPKDFGKPQIEKFGARSGVWNAALALIQHKTNSIVAALTFPDQLPDSVTAWPRKVYLSVDVEDETAALNISLSWFDKRANRMPEAFWLTFNPITAQPRQWSLSKVERPVSPFDVVSGGNRHMHALTGPLTYQGQDGSIAIQSLDAAVVSLGVLSAISFSNAQPDIFAGMHYSLFNNGWGTNYVQWFGENAQFRFRITL